MRIVPVLWRAEWFGSDQVFVRLSMRDAQGVERQARFVTGEELRGILTTGAGFPTNEEEALKMLEGKAPTVSITRTTLRSKVTRDQALLSSNDFITQVALPHLKSCSQVLLSLLWKVVDPTAHRTAPLSRRS